ncbi:MAG: DUF58 domain-containing protein [Candidatus Marinimicrobia bacterium]|nr:DUF58 domain-containing protein [Candidatus Neomarinimicrobiota bacterium]|tara:strand:+ start:4353 stop:5228 length:876 start_codon:yes stop_codon:yes gene_type:complete
MIPAEILKKVRHIEIRSRSLVNDIFGGEYHSVFKGRGMTFSEVREYQPGDDIRLIDWNVTARYNAPFVKIYEEERELTVFIIYDASRSGHFGTHSKFKSEIAAEIGAVLGFSAIKNNDKVGLLIFSDKVERFVPPKKGSSHVLRVVRELIYHKAEGRGTNINSALNYLLRVANRRSVVFLISDFMGSKISKTLKIVNKKHDLIGVKVFDSSEINIPEVGLVKVHDAETEETFWLDTTSYKARKAYAKFIKEQENKFSKECKRLKFDLIPISTNTDYVEPMISYFKTRERRY